MRLLALTLSAALMVATGAQATERRAIYEGRVRVIDGDTFQMGRDKLRLWGVDAPERDQQCIKDRQAFHCGRAVSEAVRTYIGTSRVRCEFKDWNPGRAMEHSDRAVVRCLVRGVDLADWLISRGLAIPYYVNEYHRVGMRACESQIGLWAGSFARPSSYRRQGDFTSDTMGAETRRPCTRSLRRRD